MHVIVYFSWIWYVT